MNPILHSNIIGTGKPLVILHGFLGMSDNWKTLGKRYAAQGMEVHLVDQRNHGKSFWSPEFSIKDLTADLRQYMDEHQLANCGLIGHSMGGKVAMRFALDYPERVEKLLVADMAPRDYPPHHHQILNALNALSLNELQSRSAADEALAKQLPDWGIRQFLLKNLYWIEKGRLGFRFNLEVLSGKMEAIGEGLNGQDSFPGPTLFLKGGNSDYVTGQDTSDITNFFPNASIQTIENAGHWLHAEQPEQFFQMSLEFLNSQF